MRSQFPGWPLKLDTACVQQIRAIRDVERAFYILLYQQYGDARIAQLSHKIKDLVDQLWGKTQGGFVQHQQQRPGHKPSRNSELLLLTTRESTAWLFKSLTENREASTHRLNVTLDCGAFAPGSCTKTQILLNTEAGEDVSSLRHQRNPSTHNILRGLANYRSPGKCDRAPRRSKHAGDGQ
jgi:hypothetical protein